jgi:hypothetical protein
MDEEKINNIKNLLNLNGTKKSHEQTIINIVNSIKHLIPNFKKFDDEQFNLISKEIEDNIISIYDKYLTNEDILNIIEFYKSETGKLYLNKMGVISIEIMNLGNKYGELIYNKLIIFNNDNQENPK